MFQVISEKNTERERERETERDREPETETERDRETETENRDRERDLKSMAADRNSIIISYINAITWKIPSYRCFE